MNNNKKENQYSITGQLGLVLLVDKDTLQEVIKTTPEYSANNLLNVGIEHTPHITLFHSKLKNVSMEVIDGLLDRIIQSLPIDLSFEEISVYGGKFLFWNINRTPELASAHECALALSTYFVPEGEQQTDKEKLALSKEEIENVKEFGHPLVRELWCPHITLGYYPSGTKIKSVKKIFRGVATGVAFVRIGEAGSIAEIIDSRTL